MNSEDPKSVDQAIELWKTTILTQQHFNTLQLQLRNVVLTLFVAVLTAVGYGIKEHVVSTIFGIEVPLASLACVVGIIVVVAFFYTDWGYHQLLIGAVKHGMLIEESLKKPFPEALLTKSIKDASSKKKFLRFLSTGSENRLLFFYLFLILALVIPGFATFFGLSASETPNNEGSRSSLPRTAMNIASKQTGLTADLFWIAWAGDGMEKGTIRYRLAFPSQGAWDYYDIVLDEKGKMRSFLNEQHTPSKSGVILSP